MIACVIALAVLTPTPKLFVAIVPGGGKKYDCTVRFTNGTPRKVILLKEPCSWGYGIVSFEWKDARGGVHPVRRLQRGWDKNFVMPLPIESGKSADRRIKFYDGTWSGLPAGVAGTPLQLQMRAFLAIGPDPELKGYGIWLGHAKSSWTSVVARP